MGNQSKYEYLFDVGKVGLFVVLLARDFLNYTFLKGNYKLM